MPYTVKKYPQGTFSWADFFSTDITASKKFLTGLFGWTSEDMPTGQGRPDYTMFYLDGKTVAGGSPTFSPDMPSFWNSYVTVNNVDDMANKAASLGGKVTMPPMDVLDVGKMAGITDPTGANLNLWQPKKHIGTEVVNIPGAMSWNELYTKDLPAAEKFYSKLFGWKIEISAEMDNYHLIKNNGRSNGGIYPITPEMGSMPPNWIVYFTVKNLAESLSKVKELGGKIWMDTKDISVGKIGMVADPAGASFMLMELSVKPDEWVD